MEIKAWREEKRVYYEVSILSNIKKVLRSKMPSVYDWYSWFRQNNPHCRCNDSPYISSSDSIEHIINFDVAYDKDIGEKLRGFSDFSTEENAEEVLQLFNKWFETYGRHAINKILSLDPSRTRSLDEIVKKWTPEVPLQLCIGGNIYSLHATLEKDLENSVIADIERQYETVVGEIKKQIADYQKALEIKAEEKLRNSLPSFPKWFRYDKYRKRTILCSYNVSQGLIQLTTPSVYQPIRWTSYDSKFKILNPIKPVRVWLTFCIEDDRVRTDLVRLEKPLGKVFRHYHTLDRGYDCLGGLKSIELDSMPTLETFIETLEYSYSIIARDEVATRHPKNKYLPHIDDFKVKHIEKESWEEEE